MPTRRLFDEDSHLCLFDARVTAVRVDLPEPSGSSLDPRDPEATPESGEPDGGPWVALDETAFFPAEGGQRRDRGHLSGIAVTGLLLDPEGTIWHRMERDPGWSVGDAVSGWVDPSVRRDHRQQHSGQHILSRIFSEKLVAATHSFHMGEEVSTIDIDDSGHLDLPSLLEIEDRANEIVMSDLPVTIHEDERPGRRPLRTVVIEGIETQHCCGTHVKRTGEVGLIKVLRWERSRGLTRVTFVCGGRALKVYQRLIELVDRAARPFSAGWYDLPRAVEGLIEQSKEVDRRARHWQGRWAMGEADRLAAETPRRPDGTLWIAARVGGADAETLRAAAKRILDRGRAVLVLAGERENGKTPWVAAKTHDLPEEARFDAGLVLKSLLAPLGGRGGGTASFAQGSCPAEERACRDALDRAFGGGSPVCPI